MPAPARSPIVDRTLAPGVDRSALAAQLKGLDDTDCTYFLCPDAACKLFEKPDCRVPCERDCPKQAEKVIVCFSCKRPILLPADHFSWCRVDCDCGASNFQRMSSRYRRHNLSP